MKSNFTDAREGVGMPRAIMFPRRRRILLAVGAGAAAVAAAALLSDAPSVGLSWLAGDVVLVQPRSRTVVMPPSVDSSQVTCVLRNITSRPVTVVGAKATCGCVAAVNLPITIEPSGRRDLAVSVARTARRGTERAPVEQDILLYLDTPGPRPVATFKIVYQ